MKLNLKETVEVKKHLKDWFSIFGIPREFLSDNGGEYNYSLLMKKIANEWKFEHMWRRVDNYVESAKLLIKKCTEDGSSIEMALLNFCNTPRDNLTLVRRFNVWNTHTLLPVIESHLSPKMVDKVSINLKAER